MLINRAQERYVPFAALIAIRAKAKLAAVQMELIYDKPTSMYIHKVYRHKYYMS